MAKAELGTKRTCPETGKNFYDLNKDPIVSPYTGNEYPLSFFETVAKPTKAAKAKPEPETPEEDEDEIEDDADTGRAESDADGDDEDEDDEAKALELGEDADEVVIEGSDKDDEGDAPGGVPAGFTEEGVDDDDEDVILENDDDDFDIDDDGDIDLDDGFSDSEDQDKA